MAHHKRKGPKSTRAGCLLCKPHKRQGQKGAVKQTRQEKTAAQKQKEGQAEATLAERPS
jgi:hypothetical protein